MEFPIKVVPVCNREQHRGKTFWALILKRKQEGKWGAQGAMHVGMNSSENQGKMGRALEGVACVAEEVEVLCVAA